MTGVDLFDSVILLPEPNGTAEYNSLVGLDTEKTRLVKEALLLVDPSKLSEWVDKFHRGHLAALNYFRSRPPLFILAGDVGTGKTTLARTFGNEVARLANVQIQLYVLSLKSRGSGAVGEMTRLISAAFEEVQSVVGRSRGSNGRSSRGIIFLIDEADSLAQSRENTQMHHEDRAGVNALIRGIDGIASNHLPVTVLMCTNRLDAIDPAVRRRAAIICEFKRPSTEQRLHLLREALGGSGISEEAICAIADATGPCSGRKYGFTYSDLTQRLVPSIVLDAFPDRPIDGNRALSLAKEISPTPPFQGGENGK